MLFIPICLWGGPWCCGSPHEMRAGVIQDDSLGWRACWHVDVSSQGKTSHLPRHAGCMGAGMQAFMPHWDIRELDLLETFPIQCQSPSPYYVASWRTHWVMSCRSIIDESSPALLSRMSKHWMARKLLSNAKRSPIRGPSHTSSGSVQFACLLGAQQWGLFFWSGMYEPTLDASCGTVLHLVADKDPTNCSVKIISGVINILIMLLYVLIVFKWSCWYNQYYLLLDIVILASDTNRVTVDSIVNIVLVVPFYIVGDREYNWSCPYCSYSWYCHLHLCLLPLWEKLYNTSLSCIYDLLATPICRTGEGRKKQSQ